MKNKPTPQRNYQPVDQDRTNRAKSRISHKRELFLRKQYKLLKEGKSHQIDTSMIDLEHILIIPFVSYIQKLSEKGYSVLDINYSNDNFEIHMFNVKLDSLMLVNSYELVLLYFLEFENLDIEKRFKALECINNNKSVYEIVFEDKFRFYYTLEELGVDFTLESKAYQKVERKESSTSLIDLKKLWQDHQEYDFDTFKTLLNTDISVYMEIVYTRIKDGTIKNYLKEN